MSYVKDDKEAEQLMNEVRNLINRAIVYLKNYGKPNGKLLDLKSK